MKVLVLNGWAASVEAWSLCRFFTGGDPDLDVELFSYIDQLDGRPERTLDAAGRSVVVGWSMGGSGALRLAVRSPEKIAGLILLAATPRMMEERECADPLLANVEGVSSWRGMSPRRLAALETGLRMTNGAGFFGVPEGRPNPYAVDSGENLSRGVDYLRGTDIRRELVALSRSGALKCPVYVFQSEKDGIVRPENAAFLSRAFPFASVMLIPGAEHALPVAVPDEIDRAVFACLRASASL